MFLLTINLCREGNILALTKLVYKWLWALVGAGHGNSDTFKKGCNDFLSDICNDTQWNQDWAIIICIGVSREKHLCIHLLLLALLLNAIISPKNYHFVQKSCILYTMPNHSSKNQHERLVLPPFSGAIQCLLPRRNTTLTASRSGQGASMWQSHNEW